MNADVAQVILFQCCVDRLNRIRKLGTIIAAAHHQQSCNTSQNESLLCRTPSSFRCHKNSPFAPSTKGALQLVEKTLDSVAWRRNVRLDAAVEIHKNPVCVASDFCILSNQPLLQPDFCRVGLI